MTAECVAEKGSTLKLSQLTETSFETLLLASVDEALSMLGENCKQTVYHYIKENYKISRHEIPAKIDKFAQAIESIFGVAAKLIEIQIMKNLHAKTKCFTYITENQELTLTQYVNTVKALHKHQE